MIRTTFYVYECRQDKYSVNTDTWVVPSFDKIYPGPVMLRMDAVGATASGLIPHLVNMLTKVCHLDAEISYCGRKTDVRSMAEIPFDDFIQHPNMVTIHKFTLDTKGVSDDARYRDALERLKIPPFPE